MYDRILFPTDGSNQARALEHAVDIAELSDGTLHTLYVVNDGEIPETDRDQIIGSYEREGANAIEHVEDVAAERDVAVMGDIEQGTPHEAILNYAPVILRVPANITVREVDPVSALQSMTYYLQ